MLSNLHTHTNFCDGDNTAEEIVQKALLKGFSSIGFSGHGYTSHDLRYCMKDTEGYVKEINRLKEKYKKDIQIYLGTEEDITEPCDRERFDYVISSSHYLNGNPIDSSKDYFNKLLILYDNNIIKIAEDYYSTFCDYILKRKPDIIGHFDLITKYSDNLELDMFSNRRYMEIAEKYMDIALKSDCIFEVNTGAMARGYRKSPYPYENLLHLIKKRNGKLTLTSDCHVAENLDFGFSETKAMLKDMGFSYLYVLYDNKFRKDYL